MAAFTRHEDGSPVMTPSALESLETQYRLTSPEAEQVFRRVADGEEAQSVVDEIKASRDVPATSHPLTVADERNKDN